jgi:hypothetical protein
MIRKFSVSSHAPGNKPMGERKQVFTKIFRWRPPAGQTDLPAKVEVAGTFSDWKKLAMTRDVSGGWQVILREIPLNHTHRYMILADGKPVQDNNSDGFAVPQGEEGEFAVATPRGPRVYILFAQTK